IKDAQLYCKKELGLEEYDVEDIGDNECSIELNPSVREILKSKVKQSEQSV
ncbi:MAG: hypothetical protein HOJ35_00290, partial [Bdellovibrionales bacterium]|nr:hypothetical protein [Bdellovibrionales bacterium]